MQCLKRFLRVGGGDKVKICLTIDSFNFFLTKEERSYFSNVLNARNLSLALDLSKSRVAKKSFEREMEIKIFSRCNISTSTFRYNKTISTIKALPLRNKKGKSNSDTSNYFVDMKLIKVSAGNGGDGAISFLSLFANEYAGPDGGDGGNGGHVILQASEDVTNLNHVKTILEAEDGEKGMNKDCFGKNADHLTIKVPLGTIVRDNVSGKIVADLSKSGEMFIAARGGAGGHGNAFFKSDTEQSPKISEYGGEGESKEYIVELRTMANVGLIGLPNAGKSTLLRAISRARPKVAPYPFTTLKPHVGIVQYDDYEQIAVADLPGLISDSHKNRGLGITFLKHAERCAALLIVIDMSVDEPWNDLDILKYELNQFSADLLLRPLIVIANKMDLPEANENLKIMREKTDLPIVPISAKMGNNLSTLLTEIRILYNEQTGKDFYGKKLSNNDDDDDDDDDDDKR